jgi:hypothetical protein
LFVSFDIFPGLFFPLQYQAWLLFAFSPFDAFFVWNFTYWKNSIQPFY